MEGSPKGVVVVISGPSGVGKNTIAARLMERDGNCVRVTTATTRRPRCGEKAGRDYCFFTEREFLRKLDEGYFLEYAQVFGHLYGTPVEPVHTHVQQGKTVLLLIDVQGARQVRTAALPTLFIFVAPPNPEALLERLNGRGLDGEEEVRSRLAESERELDAADEYDHTVVNDDLNRAVGEIETLIRERCRSKA